MNGTLHTSTLMTMLQTSLLNLYQVEQNKANLSKYIEHCNTDKMRVEIKSGFGWVCARPRPVTRPKKSWREPLWPQGPPPVLASHPLTALSQ